MTLTFDPAANVAYLRIGTGTGPVRTVAVAPDLNVDLAADGTVYGIELLDANSQLLGGPLVIEDATGGSRVEVPLPKAS